MFIENNLTKLFINVLPRKFFYKIKPNLISALEQTCRIYGFHRGTFLRKEASAILHLSIYVKKRIKR